MSQITKDDHSPDITDLVRNAISGDVPAFEQLYEIYGKRVIYYLRKFLYNPEDAYEIAQEVWISAYVKLPGLRDPAAFRPWIFTMARNRAVDFLRARKTEIRETDEIIEAAGNTEPSFEIDHSNIDLVHRALDRLSKAHREVTILYFFEGLSIKELAGIIGISEGTVKSRLFHARSNLRLILERLGK